MEIRVLFFGVTRDITGLEGERIELSAGAKVEDLYARYVQRFPRLGEMRRSLALAVNQDFASPERELREMDEVAFLPPVSGG